MTVDEVLAELEKLGTEQTRKTFARHGAGENFFGVKVADLKKVAKKIKGEQELALELFDTENLDARYLAGMVADGSQMTRRQLEAWAKNSTWTMQSEYSVPWVVTEHSAARDLAVKWMKSKKGHIASCGWSVYSGLVAVRPDDELDLAEVKTLLADIPSQIDAAPDRVRYTMNGFVISVGTYVKPLLKQAKAAAKKLGKVEVNMDGTACKVPLATTYIEKVETAGRVGKKRKTIRC